MTMIRALFLLLLAIFAATPHVWPSAHPLDAVVDELVETINAIREDTRTMANNSRPAMPNWLTVLMAVVGFLGLFWGRVSVVWGRLVERARGVEPDWDFCGWIFALLILWAHEKLRFFRMDPSEAEQEVHRLADSLQRAQTNLSGTRRQLIDLQRDFELLQANYAICLTALGNVQRERDDLRQERDDLRQDRNELRRLIADQDRILPLRLVLLRPVGDWIDWVRRIIIPD